MDDYVDQTNLIKYNIPTSGLLFMEKMKLFLQESKREFARVNWPTTQETFKLTVIVVAMSIGVALFLGIFDFLFLYGLENLI